MLLTGIKKKDKLKLRISTVVVVEDKADEAAMSLFQIEQVSFGITVDRTKS
jgi:hypothetical protein